MRLDLDDQQRDIQQAARDLLTARESLTRARAVADGPTAYDAELWGELCRLGWPGIAVPGKHGGQGLGSVELAVVLEEHGRGCAPTPLLGAVLAGLALTEAGSEAQRARWLPDLAHGAVSAFGFTEDGSAATLVGDAGNAELALILRSERRIATLVEYPALHPARTIDPTRSYGFLDTVSGEVLFGDATRAYDRMLVAVAAELVGLSQRALELTLDHVKGRRQFGTPIASFQSVAHLAAEMFRDVEAARWATLTAATAIDLAHQDVTATAATAASAAVDTAVSVTATSIQLHGAVGFTWESDIHFLYKRAHVTARLIGGSRPHRTRALRATIAGRAAKLTA